MLFQVAIPNTPFDYLDYLPPDHIVAATNHIGKRITVPFRKGQRLGIIVGISTHSEHPTQQLKHAIDLIDNEAILTPQIHHLCQWAAHYYHAPVSELMNNALPKALRSGKAAEFAERIHWQLTEQGQRISAEELARAPKQWAAIMQLQQTKSSDGITLQTLRALEEKALVESRKHRLPPSFNATPTQSAPTLNAEQQHAVDAISKQLGSYSAILLEGITGSGKTEVYLQCVAAARQKQQQSLILVPEIGLTPQLVQRFQRRFSCPIAVIHSGLNEQERLNAWLMAKQQHADIVIGTRSAIFTPMPSLGLIIIDEEHDRSFKQQDGTRYNAHDLALVRAQQDNVPIVLGSATPSLESLYNCQQLKYHHLKLTQRAGNAKAARYQVIDIRNQSLQHGLSNALKTRMQQHLSDGHQVLLFINRRGYAPVLMCHKCGWSMTCPNCDTHMTVHLKRRHLQCHHCTHTRALIDICPNCPEQPLQPVGFGTERLENYLQENFADYTTARIDRDTMSKKHAFKQSLQAIHDGKIQILIGTQMLAKGHHFPNVTLVGVINADSGFYSSDFRASEQLGQLLMQVAGRSGRAEHAGEVMIQTHLPEHPLLNLLLKEGYTAFAQQLLQERQQSHLPPYHHLALLRAENRYLDQCMQQLQQIKQSAQQHNPHQVQLLGPIPAAMAKRAGIYRAQLLLRHSHRSALHQLLSQLTPQIRQIKKQHHAKLILDVDPLEVF